MVPFKQSKKLNKNIESKKRFYPLKSDLHTLSDEKIKKFIIPKIEEFIVKN